MFSLLFVVQSRGAARYDTEDSRENKGHYDEAERSQESHHAICEKTVNIS